MATVLGITAIFTHSPLIFRGSEVTGHTDIIVIIGLVSLFHMFSLPFRFLSVNISLHLVINPSCLDSSRGLFDSDTPSVNSVMIHVRCPLWFPGLLGVGELASAFHNF